MIKEKLLYLSFGNNNDEGKEETLEELMEK